MMILQVLATDNYKYLYVWLWIHLAEFDSLMRIQKNIAKKLKLSKRTLVCQKPFQAPAFPDGTILSEISFAASEQVKIYHFILF